MRQLAITKCGSSYFYKVRELVITKCDSYFVTNCDKCYYKGRQVLQSVTILLQSATGITKCVDYNKVRQNRLYAYFQYMTGRWWRNPWDISLYIPAPFPPIKLSPSALLAQPSNSKNDQLVISRYIKNKISYKQVMRIKKIIN